jgi:hypothetical protein
MRQFDPFHLLQSGQKVGRGDPKILHTYVGRRNQLSMYILAELFSLQRLWSRLARWYIFKPKIPIWEKTLWNMLVNVMAIWYILWSFWYIFPVLVRCTKKNLATLNSWLDLFFKVTSDDCFIVSALSIKSLLLPFGPSYLPTQPTWKQYRTHEQW